MADVKAASYSGRNARKTENRDRKKYVLGYVLSLVLTAIAFGLVGLHVGTAGWVLTVLILLAAMQVLVQMFLFMHITEGDGTRVKSIAMGLGLFFTLSIALGSIWIMSFSNQVQ